MNCNRCNKILIGDEYKNHHIYCISARLKKLGNHVKKKKTLKNKLRNQADQINSLQKKINELKNLKVKNKKPKFISKTTHWLYDSDRWKALRYGVLKKFNFKCLACNASDVELHIDHIIPVSVDRSKAFDVDNLQVLCKDCNLSKSNKHQDDLRKKNVALVS